MCVLKTRVLPCSYHIHLRIYTANLLYARCRGGFSFYGTVLTERQPALVAQGKHLLSCVILVPWADLRYCSLPFRRHSNSSMDAQHRIWRCFDRWPAVRDLAAFSFLRFCGFYIGALAAASDQLRESSAFFSDLSGDPSELWLRRMAGPAASDVQ